MELAKTSKNEGGVWNFFGARGAPGKKQSILCKKHLVTPCVLLQIPAREARRKMYMVFYTKTSSKT